MVPQGLGKGRERDWSVHTPLDVVGELGEQRGVVGCPGRGVGCEVQWEVQKGNDDRCAVGASAWDVQHQANEAKSGMCMTLLFLSCLILPHIDLSTDGHLEAATGRLQGTEPLPQGPSVNKLVDVLSSHQSQGKNDGVGGSQV